MAEDYQTKKSCLNYCCPAKQYFCKDENILGSVLKISPRAKIYKKSLKVQNAYEFTVNVINQSLYKRYLSCSTDSCDTSVRILPVELTDNFLLPEQTLQICVHIKPNTKLNINRRRHVFITSQHPSIRFSIPIIILTQANDNEISLPSCVTFAPATVDNFTYHTMVIYNNTTKNLQFNIKYPIPNFALLAKSLNIMNKDYCEVLLKLNCKDYNVIASSFKLKFYTGESYDIQFKHEPLKFSLFVNTLSINYDFVLFQRKKTQKLSICNESNKNIEFHVNYNMSEETLTDVYEEQGGTNKYLFQNTKNIDKFAYKHFSFQPNCGIIKPKSSYFVKFTFCPVMHDDFLPNDEDVSPFSVMSTVSISWQNDMNIEKRDICLNGQIIGPEIEILPAVLDLRNVYFGEEHCFQITVFNKDDICEAHVDFLGILNSHNARVVATPTEGLTLKPKENDLFHIKFYSTTIGAFLVKLEFKVKNGAKYSVIIKGYSKHVRIKCFPEVLSLDVIPIAIPQKRFVLLLNPLTVPVTVQCTVRGDGNETPLILNTHDVEEHLPITVKAPFNYMKQTHNDECGINNLWFEEDFEFNYDFEEQDPALLSMHSHTTDNSSCSSEFQSSVLDLVPDMSHNLISYLKTIKIFDKPEIEKTVMEEVLNELLNMPYFFGMDKHKNYTQMDWNCLATDPQEIYCNLEIIYLKPNTGKAISIMVIPNVLGFHCKYIELRICPLVQTINKICNETTADMCQIVETDYMRSKLCIQYNCGVPEIVWDNVIIMENPLYAGEFYDFQMVFENNSNFGGFFYYDVIPQSSLGIMKFSNNKWKYFIGPRSKINVPCQVKFLKLGSISLYGLIKFLGVYTSYPFHIKAQVLPPKVNLFPQSISTTLTVLEYAKLYIFIENATPTVTWFKLELKDETCMSIEPCGGQLAPNGQAICVALNIRFQDPGTYKNILYIIMEFETIEKIPIAINVKGIPIFFEPEVRRKDLSVGYILCNTEDDICEDNPNFSKVIKVINKGLRHYRLSIARIKCSAKPQCSITLVKAKFMIKPNNMIVPPLSEISFNISISCSEETSVFNEFRIQLTDQNDITQRESYRFILSATFIMPQLSWNKRDITMNYSRDVNNKAHGQWETIKLTNNTQNVVDYVNLKISGPFKMKEILEHSFKNELNFSMAELETKQFFIIFNNEVIRNHSDIFYEGRITCLANSRVQKSVRIKLLAFVPKITLKQNQVILFTKNGEGQTYIELVNTDDVSANYKWKKLKEEWTFLNKEDEVHKVASLILSDLISTLEMQTSNTESDLETNTTRQNHIHEWRLEDLNDLIYIKEIIYEVIDSLKLQDHKTQSPLSSACVVVENQSNVEYYVNYILDDIVGYLKLEDSNEVLSLPSDDTCDLKRSVYFFEKCGLLQPKQKEMCALHIPSIEKDIEVRAIFQLYVSGDKCQQLEIILVNWDKIVAVNKQHIYLGLKPWYERYRTKSYIENLTKYHLPLKLNKVPKNIKEKLPKIALGFNNILGNKTLYLSPFQNTVLQTEGIIGFNEEFEHEISVIINESEEEIIKVYGHGAMPMLTISKPMLPLVDQYPDEIIEEYHILRKIYYFNIFKIITEKYEEFLNAEQEQENNLQKVQNEKVTDLPLPSIEVSTESLETLREETFLNLMRSYVLVNNNENLPNCTVLNQILQTQKFLRYVRHNSEISSLLSCLYQNYLLHHKSYDEKLLMNLKHFNIQTLPFHLKANILEMGKVYINQYCKFVLTLEFKGPGKLIAAARTAIKIPGLMIDFQTFENDEKNNFTYYCAEDKLNLCDKPYRNVSERVFDRVADPKVKHAHSYDFNPQKQHQRVTAIMNNNNCVKNYYNSLSKSIYLEQQHHFTYCKIAANRKYTNSGTKINVIILFRPQKSYFDHNQNVEDYLYIDLHMGATFPILLRALIIDRNRKENLY